MMVVVATGRTATAIAVASLCACWDQYPGALDHLINIK